MFNQVKETEFSGWKSIPWLSFLNINFKDKDVFPVLDTDVLVLHSEAYKGYVRTELAITIKCLMSPG